MSFSPQYIDHFTKPRGVGECEDPDSCSEVEHKGGGCFDRIKLTLEIEDERISKTRFLARACSGTIAACSAICEKTEGMKVEDAKNISADDIAEHLGGVPEKKQHSVELAVQSLMEALNAND